MPFAVRSDEMNAVELPGQMLPSVARSSAKPSVSAAKSCWADTTARSEPMADASLPDKRARNRLGMAMAAMTPMIPTTIRSSMSVKPRLSLRAVM